MTDLLTRSDEPCPECGKALETSGMPRSGAYCDLTGTFTINGTLLIFDAAASSSGTYVLTPVPNFAVTLVTKQCQTPARVSIPTWPSGSPANTYCKDGEFDFHYTTSGSDGTFTFTTSNAMAAVVYPGRII